MLVISTREFRERQGQYLGMVSMGQEVILKSRKEGSFKIVPVTEDDTLMSKDRFMAKINQSRKQHENGNYKTLTPELRKQLLGDL